MSGFPVHHQLPELTQTHVHRVSDAIQPSQPLLSSSLVLLDFYKTLHFLQNIKCLWMSTNTDVMAGIF